MVKCIWSNEYGQTHVVKYIWSNAYGQMRVVKCTLSNASCQMHVVKCMWLNACGQMHMVKWIWSNAHGQCTWSNSIPIGHNMGRFITSGSETDYRNYTCSSFITETVRHNYKLLFTMHVISMWHFLLGHLLCLLYFLL